MNTYIFTKVLGAGSNEFHFGVDNGAGKGYMDRPVFAS